MVIHLQTFGSWLLYRLLSILLSALSTKLLFINIKQSSFIITWSKYIWPHKSSIKVSSCPLLCNFVLIARNLYFIFHENTFWYSICWKIFRHFRETWLFMRKSKYLRSNDLASLALIKMNHNLFSSNIGMFSRP